MPSLLDTFKMQCFLSSTKHDTKQVKTNDLFTIAKQQQ